MAQPPKRRRPAVACYAVLSVLAVVLHEAVPVPLVRWGSWHVLGWAAVVALLVGPRWYRPRARRPWHHLAAGMILLASASLVVSPVVWGEPTARSEDVAALMMGFGYLLIGLGALGFARAQSGGSDHGPALDSAMVTLALTAALFEALVVRHGGAAGLDAATIMALLVGALSASWVAAMTTRVMLAGGYREASGWLLLASSIAGMVGSFVFLLGAADTGLVQGRAPLGWLLATPLLGVAALHPSMRHLTEPTSRVDDAQVWVRTVLSATALVAAPLAVLVRHVWTGEAAIVSAAASVVIGLIVSVRFGDLVRQRERARRASMHMSLHDALTGLPNRMLLDDRLRRALRGRSERGVAVLFVDLDGFKTVNDTFGHAAGDAVLVAVADRLLGLVRPTDTVARFAGDEFVIVLEDADASVARQTADRILHGLREAVPVTGGLASVTASIGISLARPGEVEPDALLLEADAAMYAGKAAGRDVAVVAPATRA